MKKILALVTLAFTLSGLLSALGQEGYFFFNSGSARSIWDGFTSDHMQLAATMRVAFLWGQTNATPIISTIQISTPTNSASEVGFDAWTPILNDPNFHLAVDATTSSLASNTNLANGVFNYAPPTGGSFVRVSGTVPGDYKLFVIGWDKTFATPQMAAAAGSVVGWSNPFIYTAADNLSTASSFKASGFIPFGVSVPEPSSFALASLGGFALLLIRRRNKVE